MIAQMVDGLAQRLEARRPRSCRLAAPDQCLRRARPRQGCARCARRGPQELPRRRQGAGRARRACQEPRARLMRDCTASSSTAHDPQAAPRDLHRPRRRHPLGCRVSRGCSPCATPSSSSTRPRRWRKSTSPPASASASAASSPRAASSAAPAAPSSSPSPTRQDHPRQLHGHPARSVPRGPGRGGRGQARRCRPLPRRHRARQARRELHAARSRQGPQGAGRLEGRRQDQGRGRNDRTPTCHPGLDARIRLRTPARCGTTPAACVGRLDPVGQPRP